mmetsp:Transcript_4561/g.10439  ORF Transcript_4561/g.10439 Transcript_4561/m.10439 type:complete len:429 (+) Transcript_4561:94-1380(+)
MDLLTSLNLEDLPEQQTRVETLFGSDPEFDRKLGFDSCCACGKGFTKVECLSCHRVKYCSNECRHKDSAPSAMCSDDENEDGERALGHTSVICALLGLCNDDEAVEAGDEKELSSFSDERRNAATDRVASEFESYPATLANVLMEGPCYQEALQKSASSMFTIHVIGSSTDSELWEGHPSKEQERNVFSCYADALAEISEQFKMKSIVLQFFGPECPKTNIDKSVDIPPIKAKQSSTKLRITTSGADYDGSASDKNQYSPDILVFFNPGFTCPDYNWEKTLSSCMKDNQLPFLVTTNTEMEALADMQYLFDRKIFQDIPPTLKFILENAGGIGESVNECEDEDEDSSFGDDSSSFFSLNPYCGLRVRQSGTMANDLYVKSRWIFGGFSGPSREAVLSKKEKSKSSSKGKRKRVDGTNANSKKANPALV